MSIRASRDFWEAMRRKYKYLRLKIELRVESFHPGRYPSGRSAPHVVKKKKVLGRLSRGYHDAKHS